MLINNPDALKNWLEVILEPLCDADSSALARYVLALLKKDKPEKDLKKVMIEQLEVFLSTSTISFVDRLFVSIESGEYLIPIENPAGESNADQEPPTITDSLEFEIPISEQRECTPPLEDTKTKELNKNDELSTPSSGHTSSVSTIVSPLVPTKSVSPFKATSDKENQPRESRRRRTSLRSRSRSRSRSNDRPPRRSRSRDRRQNDRGEKGRQFRNKSPPGNDRRKGSPADRRRNDRLDRIDRRRGGGMGPGDDRSPRVGFSKNRVRSRSPTRSRSPSMERRKQHSPSSASNDSNKRQRCRDFDEKGYCVRGETCPWDHGVNPVVLESNSTLMPPHLREYNPDAPDLWTRSNNGNNNGGGGGGAGSGFAGPRGNFPHKPAAGGGGGGGVPGVYPRPGNSVFRPNAPIFPFPVNPAATPLQRELIPVPVVDANAGGNAGGVGGDVSAMPPKRRFELEDSVAIADGPSKRKIPMNSRLGPRITNMQNNCSLELRKVPRGMNTIAHLNNHFAKFGKIVNIQISYDGDPEAAIVTFSTHAEANVAYRSTEAVLNNRFIKVFWHSSEGNQQGNQMQKEDTQINGRKNSQYHVNNIPAVPTPAADAAKTNASACNSDATGANGSPATGATTPSGGTVTAAHVPPPSMRSKNNMRPGPNGATNAIIRKKQEEQAKAIAQIAHGLHKRKHELLQGYLKQMKSAVELVERVEPNDPQRTKTLETINVLQLTIDKLRKEIAAEQAQISAQMQSQLPAKKSKEQQKKELLDIELELIAQQQEGNDTTAIQKRLEELQRSAGISSAKQHFPGNGQRVNRGRPNLPVSTSVDRRPKALVITGFASEDCEGLLGHFKHFGEITKHDVDKTIPQLIISYATRGNAEHAVMRGKVFKDKRLQISWAPSILPLVPPKPAELVEKLLVKEVPTIDSSDTLPELRLEDEEEDDESEDRSWRR